MSFIRFSLIPENTPRPAGNDCLKHLMVQPAGPSHIIGAHGILRRFFLVFLPLLLFLQAEAIHNLRPFFPMFFGILQSKSLHGSFFQRFRILSLDSGFIFFQINIQGSLLKTFLLHPGGGAGTAPVTADNAHRDLQYRLNASGKGITGRGKIGPGLIPFPEPVTAFRNVFFMSGIRQPGNIEHMDFRIAFRCFHSFPVSVIAEEIFHIGLAAGNPYLPD